MSDPKIEPALSPARWADLQDPERRADMPFSAEVDSLIAWGEERGLAAWLLSRQPNGPTWDHVRLLRGLAAGDAAPDLLFLAEWIASLLPPEDP